VLLSSFLVKTPAMLFEHVLEFRLMTKRFLCKFQKPFNSLPNSKPGCTCVQGMPDFASWSGLQITVDSQQAVRSTEFYEARWRCYWLLGTFGSEGQIGCSRNPKTQSLTFLNDPVPLS